jgi:drug/metabolite transporter (DMT)-like permease
MGQNPGGNYGQKSNQIASMLLKYYLSSNRRNPNNGAGFRLFSATLLLMLLFFAPPRFSKWPQHGTVVCACSVYLAGCLICSQKWLKMMDKTTKNR